MEVIHLCQEYDCPRTNMDFDLCGEEIVAEGDVVICSCCNKEFIATKETIANTYIKNLDDTLTIVELPKNDEERQTLIARAKELWGYDGYSRANY